MNFHQIKVRKKNGEIVDFSENKLRNSLRHSGAEEENINKVINFVTRQLYDNITTTEIYKIAYEKLRNIRSVFASRYKLKNAIYELGPSGFPFERLISVMLDKTGYTTEIGAIIKGKCVEHEIDVLAKKENKYHIIECKFHSDEKYICNVKIPLYIHSRYRDLKKNWHLDAPLESVWIATNTRFSDDAVKYAKCNQIYLLSWNYPKGNGIRDIIGKLGLYPLTVITILSDEEKDKLLENDIVLCSELAKNHVLLNKIGVSKVRKERVLDEIKQLCQSSSIYQSVKNIKNEKS
jgi:hypothetical protein